MRIRTLTAFGTVVATTVATAGVLLAPPSALAADPPGRTITVAGDLQS